jgi:hypothetical protein
MIDAPMVDPWRRKCKVSFHHRYITTSSVFYTRTLHVQIFPKLSQLRTYIKRLDGIDLGSLEISSGLCPGDKSWLIIPKFRKVGREIKLPPLSPPPPENRLVSEKSTPLIAIYPGITENQLEKGLCAGLCLFDYSFFDPWLSYSLCDCLLSSILYLCLGISCLPAWGISDTMGLLYVSWESWSTVWNPSNLKQSTWNSAGMVGSQEKGGPGAPVGYRGMPLMFDPSRSATKQPRGVWLD